MNDPRARAAAIEAGTDLPEGTGERFAGYGVMAAPFASGHVLASRHFAASSIGPSYTSVWHRSPAGDWAQYSDVAPNLSCSRYFSRDLEQADQVRTIRVDWTGPASCEIEIPERDLKWSFELETTPVTRMFTTLGAVMPDRLWRNAGVLAAMSKVAGLALRAGKLRLSGRVPNGQQFVTNPREIWILSKSTASVDGGDLGAPGPVVPQAHLGDFWIAQRGLFAIGEAFFEDPAPG